MGYFNDRHGGGFRGGKGGGFKKRWDNDRHGPGSMHKATCAECGKGCEVPFRPTGDRPTYCSDCFAKKRGEGEFPLKPKREFSDRPSFKSVSGSDDLKKQIGELSAKIDRLVSTVERLARGGQGTSKDEEKKEDAKAAPLAAVKEKTLKKSEVKTAGEKTAKSKAAPAKKVAAKKKK